MKATAVAMVITTSITNNSSDLVGCGAMFTLLLLLKQSATSLRPHMVLHSKYASPHEFDRKLELYICSCVRLAFRVFTTHICIYVHKRICICVSVGRIPQHVMQECIGNVDVAVILLFYDLVRKSWITVNLSNSGCTRVEQEKTTCAETNHTNTEKLARCLGGMRMQYFLNYAHT